MSRSVRASQELTALFDIGVEGLADRLTSSLSPDGTAFQQAFDQFLYEFGSRGPNEWDPASQTWETRPALALAAIDRSRLAADSADLSTHHRHLSGERERAVTETRAALKIAGVDEAVTQQFELASACAGRWLAGRERSKTNCVRFNQEVRMTMRELGRRVVEHGDFVEVEDLAFLFTHKFPAFLADPGPFTAILAERKAKRDEFAACEPEFDFNDAPDFPQGWTRRDAIVYDQLGSDETIQASRLASA